MIENFIYSNQRNKKDSVRDIVKAAKSNEYTFNIPSSYRIYNYPASLSPILTKSLISTFSKPGQIIMDPFLGGGTTAISSLELGRNFIGVDINPLSIFISKYKTLQLSQNNIEELDFWINEIMNIELPKITSIKEPKLDCKFFRGIRPEFYWYIQKVKKVNSKIGNNKVKLFTDGFFLNCARIFLDNKQQTRTLDQFKDFIYSTFEKTIEDLLFYKASVANSRNLFGLKENQWNKLYSGDIVNQSTIKKIRSKNKFCDLVITSPPYPGISVLYNKWQINGRVEVDLPYWFIDAKYQSSSSFYTMGYPKSKKGREEYYANISAAFVNIRKILRKGKLCIVIVAFSNKAKDFIPFIDSVESGGFKELKSKYMNSFDKRIWREVPNRKWYNTALTKRSNKKEVILFFEAI